MSNCNKISFPEGPKSFFPNNAWSLVQNASLSQHDDIRVHALHLQKQDDIIGKSNEIYPSTSSFTSPNAHLTASKYCGWNFEWCGWNWETFGLPRSLYFPIFMAGVFPLINSAIQGSCSIPGSTSRVSFWLYKEHPVSSFDTQFSDVILNNSELVLEWEMQTKSSSQRLLMVVFRELWLIW